MADSDAGLSSISTVAVLGGTSNVTVLRCGRENTARSSSFPRSRVGELFQAASIHRACGSAAVQSNLDQRLHAECEILRSFEASLLRALFCIDLRTYGGRRTKHSKSSHRRCQCGISVEVRARTTVGVLALPTETGMVHIPKEVARAHTADAAPPWLSGSNSFESIPASICCLEPFVFSEPRLLLIGTLYRAFKMT